MAWGGSGFRGFGGLGVSGFYGIASSLDSVEVRKEKGQVGRNANHR